VANKQKFSAAVLKGYRVLVISNALGAPRMNDPAANTSAFTDQESDAVRDWVKGGGSLLLIADSRPDGLGESDSRPALYGGHEQDVHDRRTELRHGLRKSGFYRLYARKAAGWSIMC